MLESILQRMTAFVIRQRWFVLFGWLLPLPLFIYCFLNVDDKLKSVIGSNPTAESTIVERKLARHFSKQSQFVALLTLHHKKARFDDKPFFASSKRAHDRLEKLRCVRRVTSYHNLPIRSLFIARHGHTSAVGIEIGVPVNAFDASEACVVRIRKAVAKLKKQVPLEGMEMLVTGSPAVDLDINRVVKRDTLRAELIIVVVASLLLIWMFRSATSALLPLITAGIAVTMCLSVVYVMATYVRLSVYVSTVASMTGLGIGLDYALLYVTRFREETEGGKNIGEALAVACVTAGKAVLASGVLVMVGLAGLFIPNAGFSRSIGVAGVTIIFCTLLTTLTLLPVLLTFWHRTMSWPRWGWFRASHRAVDRFWTRWAGFVLRRPFVALGIAGLIVVLGAPHLRNIEIKNPRHEVIPKEVEARQGVDRLIEIAGEGRMYPIKVIFEISGKSNWEDKARQKRLLAALDQTRTWQEVQSVLTADLLVRSLPGGSLLFSFGSGFSARWVSDDKRMVVADYYSRSVIDKDLDHLVAKLRRQLPGLLGPGEKIEVYVGGKPSMNYETKTILYDALPYMILTAALTGLLIMGFLFRSVAIPIKAALFTGLSMATTFGILVFVFQMGNGIELLGVDEGQKAITLATPIILFCVLFGVSMDYEVFLVSRIAEYHRRGETHEEAVRKGLARTGGIITNAALIMIVTFAAFASGTLLPMKEIGFALALAVTLDATLVRMMLVPGILRLLGGRVVWWWPFGKAKPLPPSEPDR